MLLIMNYNLKEGKQEEFQKFIKENEKAIAKYAPKGWKYMGTYFYVLGFGPYCVADLWEISDYADFDRRKRKDPTWVGLGKQAVEYCTSEPAVSWLLRESGETKILEPKKKP